MRLAVLSHNYIDVRYVGKLHRLAQRAEVLLAQPESLPFEGPATRFDGPFECATLAVSFPAGVVSSTRWRLAGVGKALARFRPDVILVENEISSFIALQALRVAALLRPRPLRVAHFWQNLPPVGRYRLGTAALARLVRRRWDGYLCASSDTESMVRGWGVPVERTDIFPPVGYDAVGFPAPSSREALRACYGFAESEFVVGFSGRLVPEKGLDDLEAALADLRRRGLPVRGLVVGNGPLRERWLRNPLAVVASPKERLNAMRHYAAMDLFVVPSRTESFWREQFGRVIPEAQHAGLAVVGSSSAAIPEVVGEGGWIVPERDPRMLADAVAAAIADPAERLRRGALGRERALRLFSNEAIADRTLDFIERLRAL